MQRLFFSSCAAKVKQHLPAFILTTLVGYLIAFIFFARMWYEKNFLMHTISEVLCISLLLLTFIHVWNTYKETDAFVKWVGLTALAMALLNLPHSVNLTGFIDISDVLGDSIADISLKYGVLIAYIEILLWLLLVFYKKGCSVNRWIGLLLALATAGFLLALSVNNMDRIPEFYKELNATATKHFADYLLSVIAFAVLILYVMKYRTAADEREKTLKEYIILALCYFVTARICFATSWKVTGKMYFLSHIFKIAYYFSIYYGVYKTTIEYPYKQARKVKDFYENLLDNCPIGIVVFDMKGEASYSNKTCDCLFGCDMSKLNAISIDKFLESILFYDSGKEEVLRKLQESGIGPFTFYGLPFFAGNGACKLIITVLKFDIGIVFAVRDAKAAQALENMKLQAQTLLDSMDNMVFLLDNNKRVVMYNKKFLEITNVNKGDVLGSSIAELSGLLKSNLMDCINMDTESEAMVQDATWCIQNSAEDIKKIKLETSPICNMDNEKIGWIVIGRDVSEFEKKQEKLIHGEKMAVIGQMAAGLVHEIKNPLASIKGLCQLMISRAKPEKISEYAAVMERAVDDIGEIVSGFLQFSKPATGDFEVAYLNKLVRSLEIMISTNAFKCGIKTWFCYSKTEEAVIMRSQQIKNIILGMVDNAIDALNGAIDPRLFIVIEHDKENSMMRISVKDNGIGMTEEQLASIGTPFYTTKPRGTGLGVSVIKHIVSEHKGTLKIESKFGEGSAFTISLPCREVNH